MDCAFCQAPIKINGKIRRGDTCPKCHRDLRCCRQCNFYDHNAYNECKEVQADRVIEKDRENFCDYFVPRGSKARNASISRTVEAKKALEALFKK